MKPLHTLTILFILFLSGAVTLNAQTIHVVNNTSGAPGGNNVYTDIQDAIDSAISGDIIHIMPSTTSYGVFTLDKPLSLYGIGYNPDKQAPITSRFNNFTITAAASGSVISGLDGGYIRLQGNPENDPLTNIRIEKNNLTYISTNDTPYINQLLIQRNIISSSNNHNINLPTGSEVSNVIISNNIFAGNKINNTGHIRVGNQAIITQNLFMGNEYGAFSSVLNSQVQNNIFFGVPPSMTESSTQFTTFENNLLFGVNDQEFPIGDNGNTGSNNLIGIDPLFVNLEPTNSDWNFNWDASFQAGSPAIGAGINGEDLGFFGGAAPFDLTMVPLPLIQAFNVPGFIGTGDDLNVTIQARSNEN